MIKPCVNCNRPLDAYYGGICPMCLVSFYMHKSEEAQRAKESEK